ncbi:MAG: hypothetical protein ACREM1_25110 [Longimicrobiales bacterium]
MRSDLRHARIWYGVGWAAVIAATALSLMPNSVLQPGSLNDKLEHTAGYALLTIWFCGVYPRSRYPAIAIAFLLMGIAIEVLQGAMPWGRQAELYDVYAGAAGIALGVCLSWATPLGQWARRVEALLAGIQARI